MPAELTESQQKSLQQKRDQRSKGAYANRNICLIHANGYDMILEDFCKERMFFSFNLPQQIVNDTTPSH